MAPSKLEIRLLGPFAAAVDGVPVAEHRWQRARPKRLVKLLALWPHHRLHREQLTELLWPELDQRSAANSLNKTIHMARRALEPALESGSDSQFILTQKQQVILGAPGGLWVDVDEFERLAAEAVRRQSAEDCEAALALYRGELLVDEPFADWTSVRREQLRVLHRKLVTKLARLYKDREEYAKSLGLLKGLIAADPTDEHVHRMLMRLYALTGSKYQALEQYRLCREALRRELDAEPEPATVELSREILEGRVQPAPPREAHVGAALSFRQLTFRRGTIKAARFSPDGDAIIYAASWDGRPLEVFALRRGDSESRPLGFEGANVLSVSPSGELALCLDYRFLRGYTGSGQLARVPPGGGGGRVMADGAQWADWSPDGGRVAVVRDAGGRNRLEYPPGQVLYETGGWVSHPRFSPDGGMIAFLEHPVLADDSGAVAVIDISDRKKRTLADGWASAQGLAWSAGGEEVWFTASEAGNARDVYAVTLAGRRRLVQRMLGSMTLHDIARDGRVLLTQDSTRLSILGRAADGPDELDLSWHDWSLARDLSADGRTLLFAEAGEGGGSKYSTYVRGTDGSPARRLGDGSALALSPDGRWALAGLREEQRRLVLWPTGAGEPVALEPAPLFYQPWAAWFPGGDRILFAASEEGSGARLYVQDLRGGSPSPVTPEGFQLTTPHAISPDGRHIAALAPDRTVAIYCVKRNGSRPVEGLQEGDGVVRWGGDGRELYVARRGEVPARIYRLDLRTGAKEFWKEFAPRDRAGVQEILRILMTADGRAYAYTYTREFSDLYLIE